MDTLLEILGGSYYLGIFAALLLGGIGFPFPEDATLIACGALVSRHATGLVPTLAVAYAGLLVSDFVLYSIGRRYGRPVVTHRRFHRLLSPERLALMEGRFGRWGVYVILFGRHMAGLRAEIFIAAGVFRMSRAKFLLADAVTAPFTIALMFGIGYLGSETLGHVRRELALAGYAAAAAVAACLAAYLVHRHHRTKHLAGAGGDSSQ